MPDVDRTRPGSKNEWRITYSTGSQKWTNDLPGDGVGQNSPEMLEEELKDPSVQRGMDSIANAIQSGEGLEKAITDMVRDIGETRTKRLLKAMEKSAEEADAPQNIIEGITKAREMVAGIKDVVNRIFNVFDIEKAKEVAQKVVNFWKTKNKREDISPDEQRRIYRPVDYGDTLPLTKKRKLDVGWTDHAEYRSDLRDVDPERVNEEIRDRLRQKLNPPQKKKQNFKVPGLGTMVVDYDTKRNPAEADVVTVWASLQRKAVAAVMDRVNPDEIPLVWYENEEGDKFVPDLESGDPGRVPDGYDYQHSKFSDLKHSILKIITQDDVDACDHPEDYQRKDHGYDPAYGEQSICDKCGGRREKKLGEDWDDWRGEGSREYITFNHGWADDLALAMANDGIKLHKAILVAATACERCMNALAHEFGLDWGYPEMSDEWKESGTECEFCEGMGYSGQDRQVKAKLIEAYSYGCVMADLPKELATKVMDFAKLIPDEDIYGEDSGENGREDEPHVTVKYGLHTDDPKEVEGVLSKERPVKIALGGMSAFHNEDYVVLKLGVSSPDLHNLNGLISKNLECTDSFPEYKPHVTIAYLKHRKDDPYWYKKLYSRMFEGDEFELDRLRFSTADDKEYQIPLTGTASKAASKVALNWSGMVEKAEERRSESLADIVDSIPEAVAKIEEAMGVKWNPSQEKFDILSYPDKPSSDVDRVDNAPGGLTASKKV